MKRLAILTGSDIRTYGGGEKYVIELVKRLNGFDITVYSFIDKNEIRIKDKKIKKMLKAKLIYFNTITIPILKERLPLTLSGLSMLKQLWKCNTIYIVDPSVPTIFIILIYTKFKKQKPKIIFGAHNPGFLKMTQKENTSIKKLLLKFYAPIYKAVLFKVPNIHVLNNSDQKTLKKMGYKGNIYKIPNFLYYKKSDIKIEDNKNRFIVLFGGRLAVYQKGIDLLAEIIKRVINKNREIEFQIFGSGSESKKIIEDLQNKYPNNVDYLGFISNKDLEDKYKNSSLYIMTSRIETLPLVILEAQAHGLPVISFDIKGPRDIITEFSGSNIKAFDIEAFSNEILKYYNLWKKGKLNIKYKKRITDYTFNKYSDKKIIPKIKKMFI